MQKLSIKCKSSALNAKWKAKTFDCKSEVDNETVTNKRFSHKQIKGFHIKINKMQCSRFVVRITTIVHEELLHITATL